MSRLVAVLMAFVTVGLSGVALAQSTSRSTFAPSLTLLGSLSSNPLRLVGDPRESGFVAVSADLPFRLRGPRWSADPWGPRENHARHYHLLRQVISATATAR